MSVELFIDMRLIDMQEWHDSGVIRRILIVDDEPPVRQLQSAAKPGDRAVDDNALSSASNRSPFQRVKKHVKQIITGDSSLQSENINEETVVSLVLIA